MEDQSSKNVNTDLSADTNDEEIELPGIFRLPRELRDIIYGYIIDPDLSRGFWGKYDGLSLSLKDLDGGESRLGMRNIHKALSVVHTCRQLQEEIQHLLFNCCKVDVRFKKNSSRPIKDLHPFSFNLLHLCRDLRVTIPTHRAKDDAQEAPRLWSAVVAPSRSPPSTCQVRGYDLRELYPHRLWSSSSPPFENTPCHWVFVQLFRNLSELHRLKRLRVEFAIQYNTSSRRSRRNFDFVRWDLRMGQEYRLIHLTRSDYGAYPYIELVSGLRKVQVPQVEVLFESPCEYIPSTDAEQVTRQYDFLLMKNYLRRHVEDTDEARSLVDFAARDEGDFDEVYPPLLKSTATEGEPIGLFESFTPLDLRNDELSLFKCPNRRFRLFDDHNILIPPPLRENTYDAPDLLPWIMHGPGYDAGDTDDSEDFDASGSVLGGDDDLGDSGEGSEYPGHSDGWEPSETLEATMRWEEARVEALQGHHDPNTAQAPDESGGEESSGILQVFDSRDEEDAPHGSPFSLELVPVEWFDSPDPSEMCDSDSSSVEESDYEEYVPKNCLEMGRRRAGYPWVFDDLDDPEGGEGPLESAALMEPGKPENEPLLAAFDVCPEWLRTSLLPVAL
ncbi:hypothetical protein IWX90DRAFT_474287 [Phyllosticta citrichinensis]|uniref:F-box domain-containing protein n=1 Tax=Phyllosticta citrichinensis TaxID=1130410 RepID=A0ABR1Y6G8_9PEZI